MSGPTKTITFTRAELDRLSWALGYSTAAWIVDGRITPFGQTLIDLQHKIVEAPEASGE